MVHPCPEALFANLQQLKNYSQGLNPFVLNRFDSGHVGSVRTWMERMTILVRSTKNWWQLQTILQRIPSLQKRFLFLNDVSWIFVCAYDSSHSDCVLIGGDASELSLSFVVTSEGKDVPLLPNGQDVPVTAENRVRYIYLYRGGNFFWGWQELSNPSSWIYIGTFWRVCSMRFPNL